MSIFGGNITDDMVEDAVVFSLRKWVDTELRIVEETLGLPARHYGRPRAWEVHSDFDKFPDEQLPAVVAVSRGVVETHKTGGKKIRAIFEVGVLSIASSTDMDASRRYAHRLGGAIRATLAHRQSLDGGIGGNVRGVYWIGGGNRDLPVDADRSIWGIRQVFHIEVDDVLIESAGPPEPDAPPPDPNLPLPTWPVVPDIDHIHIITTKVPIDEPVNP